MKSNIAFTLTCFTASILIAPYARAQCPAATTDPRALLVGAWTYTMRGSAPKTPPKHYSAAGQFTAFIGVIPGAPAGALPVGRLTIVQSSSDGSRQEVDAGTYTVFADCSGGTLTFNLSTRPLQFDFWFDESFGEIRFVSTTPGVSIVGTAEMRQATLPPAACSGQSLITIDPDHNIAYVPIYTLDTSGNAQIAVVDLTVAASTPVLKTLSLPGARRPLATAYNPNNKTMIVEAVLPNNTDIVAFVVNTTSQSLQSVVPVALTGISFSGAFGGILEDTAKNRAFVAGTSNIGILDTSTTPPTWNAASVVSTVSTDSLSFNRTTGILFIDGDGTHQIIDTTITPLVPMAFNSTFGITDGNAFDPSTNILLVSQEVGADQSWAFNFATLTTTPPPATANNVRVPNVCPGGGTGCVGEASPIGEGPGGQAVINCTTHQGVVADEYGQNVKLIQLPTAPVPVATPLDNNGRPGSGIPADSASVYTIATAVIPKGNVSGTPTQLGMIGDPNSLAIDPAFNFAYVLADTTPSFHTWTPGSTVPLFLVRLDLSSPVSGASPTGGVNGTTFWIPAAPPSAAIRLP